MGYIISISLLYCLVVLLSNISCLFGVKLPWRPSSSVTPTPLPTLVPPLTKNPEFYRELRDNIPSKEETVKKVIENLLRIRSGIRHKRQIVYEDIVVVMDGSGSVGRCEFEKGKKAMKNVMGFVQNGFDAKYGMVTFAGNAGRDFDFQPSLVAASKMDNVSYPGGPTNTQAGLEEAFNLFIEGGRVFSERYVMLLTDGRSNRHRRKTIPNAQKLKDQGVEIYVVAVGHISLEGIEEMVNIATYRPGNRTTENLLRVKKLGDFLQFVNLAIREVGGTYELDDEDDLPCACHIH